MDNIDTKLNELQEMMRLLANNLSNMKGDLLTAIEKVDKKLSKRIDELDIKIDGVEERLTKRMDVIGL